MTDLSNYSFYFEKEVRRLIRELGAAADNIMFAYVSIIQPAGAIPPIATLPHVIAGKELPERNVAATREYMVDTHTEHPRQSSGKYSIMRGKKVIGSAVVINSNSPYTGRLGIENKPLMLLHALYHETAHVLIPEGPKVDGDHPYRECVADAYSALRLLRRFGREAASLISMISWLRAHEAIVAGTGHLSVTVLDRIVADSASCDFSALTHAEIIERARSYAKEGTPSPKMLAEVRLVSNGLYRDMTRSADTARIAAEEYLNSSSQLAAYVGAKFLGPLLHKAGADYNGGRASSNAFARRRYRSRIKKRVNSRKMPGVAKLLGPEAAPSRLRRIFNWRAKKSFTKFLQVSVPRGQKRFTFKNR